MRQLLLSERDGLLQGASPLERKQRPHHQIMPVGRLARQQGAALQRTLILARRFLEVIIDLAVLMTFGPSFLGTRIAGF
ncbi:hypothetical protein U5801_27450, partial [Lamprobacter modestohalophilus]|uniref:hypothetical protein n=1 Tax=Lamprobacter modestohalophilus TaxID=1064514 RepID=UPI002ADEB740